MRRVLALVLALVLILLLAATALAAQPVGLSFDPGGKAPTKGYVAVRAYQWLRDNHPSVIAHCDEETDQYDDLDSEGVSPFKRRAINCQASIGFFDDYPEVATTTTTHTEFGDWEAFTERPDRYGYSLETATEWSLTDTPPRLYFVCPADTEQGYAYMMLRLKLPPLPPPDGRER
ncbi:MAG: hypothetical protein OXM88_14800 [bacterium]|nr:hypothetical protein [bacterium]